MNKRSDSIRSMFASRPTEELSADNTASIPPVTRVASGSVRSMKETFSGFERENEVLRAKLSSGTTIVDVDPSLIDPSPIADRFVEGDEASFSALRVSIAERGQEVPVLLRQHPLNAGRYETAYGHRRVRAARELGLPVRAIIRSMSEEDLVVAQGVENSAREDLTFIERAVFAMRLEDRGHDRQVVQDALSVDKAEVSKLVSVARLVPSDIVNRIGRAPKAGRGRWQELAEALRDERKVEDVRKVLSQEEFTTLDSDQRFMRVLEATKDEAPSTKTDARPILSSNGSQIARLALTSREIRLVMDRGKNEAFAEFLSERLPDLYDAYHSSRGTEGS